MIRTVNPCGMYLSDTALEGERRVDDVYPAHPNGIPISHNRWLIVFATRGYRGIDDERSIHYRICDGSPVGRVIKKGVLTRSFNEWDPFGDGTSCFKHHGSPVAFGVPKDAIINGKPAPNANRFVVKWYRCGRVVVNDPEYGPIIPDIPGPVRARYPEVAAHEQELMNRTIGVEWMQLKLNEAEDDIEVLMQPQLMRLPENGEASPMNHAFTTPVPLESSCEQWVHVHSGNAVIYPIKLAYNARRGLYEWRDCGPTIEHPTHGFGEVSVAPYKGRWVLAIRTLAKDRSNRGMVWVQTDDPVTLPDPQYTWELADAGTAAWTSTPLSLYRGPDDTLLLLRGDRAVSGRSSHRDPLYLFEIDPDDDFRRLSNHTIFDGFDVLGPEERRNDQRSGLIADMGKLLPHMGGRSQWIVHRVRPSARTIPSPNGEAVTQTEKQCAGIYHAEVIYDHEPSAMWTFAGGNGN